MAVARAARVSLVSLVILVALFAVVLSGVMATPAPAGAGQPSSVGGVPVQAPTPAAGPPGSEAPTTEPAAEAPGVPAAGGQAPANTLQPTGQPLPSKRQRLADSLIAAFILLVLVGGVTVGWLLQRRSGREPAPTTPATPGTES